MSEKQESAAHCGCGECASCRAWKRHGCRCPMCVGLVLGLESKPAVSDVGAKHDTGKPRYSLLPWRGIDEVVAVLEHGARKYGEGNWRLVPEARQRYLDAALRHVRAVLGGEDLDADSGRQHLAHAVASLLFVLELDDELAERVMTMNEQAP
jgi:hypothetical protein